MLILFVLNNKMMKVEDSTIREGWISQVQRQLMRNSQIPYENGEEHRGTSAEYDLARKAVPR